MPTPFENDRTGNVIIATLAIMGIACLLAEWCLRVVPWLLEMTERAWENYPWR